MPDTDEPVEAGLENERGQAASALLDAPNRAIIEALQRDGRQPYGAIAEAVGLSEAAVRRRVQRLRESGIMQIVAVTDPLQLGFTRQAMVGISVEGDVRRVADKLTSMQEVDYVVMCAGRSTSWPRSSARTTSGCCTSSTTRCAPFRACAPPRPSCT